MRIIFVRHGEPDYAQDCLTEEGRRQAAAAAVRLEKEGIEEIYSSPCGRAYETASYTADRLNLPVTVLDYMREISWGGPDIPENGHPWTLSNAMIERENFDFYSRDWQAHPYFMNNAATEYYRKIAAEFSAFLCSKGYRHEGTRYLCTEEREKTIALFSHGGSGACALSEVLALPFPYIAAVMPYDFTSVTILYFPVRKNEYVHPRIELFNDSAHIKRNPYGPVLQQESQ